MNQGKINEFIALFDTRKEDEIKMDQRTFYDKIFEKLKGKVARKYFYEAMNFYKDIITMELMVGFSYSVSGLKRQAIQGDLKAQQTIARIFCSLDEIFKDKFMNKAIDDEKEKTNFKVSNKDDILRKKILLIDRFKQLSDKPFHELKNFELVYKKEVHKLNTNILFEKFTDYLEHLESLGDEVIDSLESVYLYFVNDLDEENYDLLDDEEWS